MRVCRWAFNFIFYFLNLVFKSFILTVLLNSLWTYWKDSIIIILFLMPIFIEAMFFETNWNFFNYTIRKYTVHNLKYIGFYFSYNFSIFSGNRHQLVQKRSVMSDFQDVLTERREKHCKIRFLRKFIWFVSKNCS